MDISLLAFTKTKLTDVHMTMSDDIPDKEGYQWF